MREHVERVLELGLAMTLIAIALSSVFRLTQTVDCLIDGSYEQRKMETREFSPKKPLNSGREAEHELARALDKYYLASEFKRRSEFEAEEQYVYVDGVRISLCKEDETVGLQNTKGERLRAEEIRPLLDLVLDKHISFEYEDSRISLMRLE